MIWLLRLFRLLLLSLSLDNHLKRIPQSIGSENDALRSRMQGVTVGRGDAGVGVGRVTNGPRDGQATRVNAAVLDAGVGGVQSHHFGIFHILHHAMVFGDGAKMGMAVIRYETRVATVGDQGK